MANSRYQFRVRGEVRRKLAKLNFSQNRLAKKLRISSGYMSQLLSGQRCAGPDVRKRLSELLPELDFDELFEEVVE